MRNLMMAAVLVVGGLVASPALAGRAPWPASHVDRVLAFDTDVYQLTFRGGELARIVVDGDGDTDLDLFVYDQFGNLVAADTDGTDYCVVYFVPQRTQTYRIEVRNLGVVYNVYTLRTN